LNKKVPGTFVLSPVDRSTERSNAYNKKKCSQNSDDFSQIKYKKTIPLCGLSTYI
jgi:hypothetical protein